MEIKQNSSIEGLQKQVELLTDELNSLKNIQLYHVEKEKCCNSLFENLFVGFVVVDASGKIHDYNQAFAHITDYSSNELLGTPFEFLLPDDSIIPYQGYLKSTIEQGTNRSVELKITRKNGDTVVINFVAHANFDSTKKYTSSSAICFDISDKVKYIEQLKHHQQNLILKDELISIKEIELKKQNAELQRLNDELKQQYTNNENLLNKIIENEYRLKLAFDSVNDGVWDWNLKTGEMYFSDRYFTMLDYEPYEFPHTFESWKNIIHASEIDNVFNIINEHIYKNKTGFSVEYRLKTKYDDYRWVLARGKVVERDEKNVPTRMVGTHVDIHNQKEIEEVLKSNRDALKRQNEEYQLMNQKLTDSNDRIYRINRQLEDKQAHLNSILKTVPAAIGLISGNIILFANEYTARMTGYSLDEIIGNDIKFLFKSENEFQRVTDLLYSNNWTENIKTISTIWYSKKGDEMSMLIHATSLDIDQPMTGITFSALDITKQKKYENDLIKSKEVAEKADQLKSAFLANMSHEIRTPMNGIIGFSELLKTQINQSKKEQYLSIIVNSSKQLLKIITDIIDIAKIETGELDIIINTFSLNKLLQEELASLKSMLETSGKSYIYTNLVEGFKSPYDTIKTDQTLLKKVINNILSNAVKFSDKGSINFGYQLKGNDLEFFVADEGIGIEPELHQAIFECFRQVEISGARQFGGNGLGLSISKGIINYLNGDIWVESEKGNGSIFYFTIPYIKDQIEEEIKEEKTKSNSDWSNYHILIVEDDFAGFSLLSEMLEITNVKLSHAATGLEAVKMCKKDETINLVLMDMRLPELDGYQATKIIKESRKNLTIIAQTAHAMPEDRDRCLKVGCNDYLSKPINEFSLLRTLKKHLS
jgi:PAS domain S-box-containing protein